MAPMYFRNAAGALLVFDATAPGSFDEMERTWLPELLPHMKNSTQFIVMCANKVDAARATDEEHKLFMAKVELMCATRGIQIFQTSAKTGQNVAEAFEALVDEILEARAQGALAEPEPLATVSFTRDTAAASGAGAVGGDGESRTRKLPRPKCCDK